MKKHSHLILSPIFVMAVFATVFAINGLFPFGDKSLSWCDMNQQVIPLFCHFKDILRGSDGFFLNLSNSGGMNFYGVFFFFLASPFTFLVAFVSKSDIPFLMNILVVLKLCASAITAGIYLNKKNPTLYGLIKTALCVSYALCGYGMLFYQNIIWLDIMYLFPLLLLGMDMLIEGRPLLFILSLSGVIIVNYYISYMVILFVILYFGLHALFFKFKEPLVYVRLALSTLCSLLLGAVVWLPSLIQYFSSGRTSNVLQGLMNCSFFSYTDTSLPVMLCTGIILAVLVLTVPRFFEQKKQVKMLLCAFFMMCIPIFIEPVNRMWHTGNYMSFPVRYGFITVFLGLCICADFLEKNVCEKSLRPGFAIMSILSCLGIGAFIYLYATKNIDTLSRYVQTLWGNKQSLQGLIILFLCAAGAYLFVLALAKAKKIGKGILSLCLILVVLAEGLCGTLIYVGTASDKLDTKNYKSFMALENQVEKQGLFRVNMESKIADANMTGAVGFNSLGHYTSLTDSNFMKAAKQFGLSGYWMEIGNWGGSILSDALLNVEYKITKNKNVYEVAPTGLGTGLAINSGASLPQELPDGNRITILGQCFGDIFGLEENPVTEYNVSYISGCNLVKDGIGNHIIKGKNDNDIIYEINIADGQTLYFDCYNGSSNALVEPINDAFSVYVNGNLVLKNYPSQSFNAPLPLGFFENEKVTVQLKVKKDVNCFSFGVFGINNNRVYSAAQRTVSPIFSQKGSIITAKIEEENLGNLFLSLPYNSGYTVTLNGKKIPYNRCLTGFTAINAEEIGVLKISFVPRGFYLGVICTLAGIIAFVVILLLNKKIHLIPRWIKSGVSVTFVVIFTLFILAVYIGPVILNLTA